jgi:hypothetical protein
MEKLAKMLMFGVLFAFISLNFISALNVDSVSIDKLYPGQTADLSVDVRNTLGEDVSDVSVMLILDKTPFTSSGSAEDSQDNINDDDTESFNYILKAPSSIKPGDYNIPYTIAYTGENGTKGQKAGSFGITVSAKTELSYIVEMENNVQGQNGKLSLKIINSGLGDIKFTYVKIISSSGFEVVSNKEIYVGTVSSDDSEVATYDVFYKPVSSASVNAEIKYKDFDNKEVTETINLPVKIYTKEEALQLGIITQSNTMTYFLVIVVLLVIWFVWRAIRKRKKKNKLNGMSGR